MALAISAALAAALAGGTASTALTTAPPLLQQGPKLTGGEADGKGYFGRAVALSADGDTALVGAPFAGTEGGMATVLARTGSTWGGQATLTDGEAGGAEGRFGHDVALSAGGDVAVVGAPGCGGGVGAAWVFTRTGSTWTRQAKLTGAGETGEGRFGTAVAVSGDGATVAVGAPGDEHGLGAVWVFAAAGSSWTQQARLTGGQESGNGGVGRGVALSDDGDTLLAGAPADDHYLGAAWVWDRSGGTWSAQAKLTGGAEEAGEARFGHSVALSGDGGTAVVGGRYDNDKLGAAWVFARAGATWTQQGAKLTPAGGETGAGEFGYSVALAGDGESALIGGRRNGGGIGAAWLFGRSGSSSWAQEGERLTGGEASGRAWFGSGVALSQDARTGLVGGVGDAGKAGAAWAFAAPEALEPQPGPPAPAVTPSSGGQGGGSSNGGAAPKQGVEAFHAVGGGVVLLSRTVRVHGGWAAVRLRCAAPVACRGRLRLVAVVARAAHRSPTTTIAAVGFSIAHGKRATVQVPLDAVGRRGLNAGHGRLHASLTVEASAPRRATHSYRVKLVRAHPR